MSMKTTDENLHTPISGQFRSSPFYVALGAPILAALASIAITALAYRVLPETVARDSMNLINPMLLAGGGGGAVGGIFAMMKRSLDITQGKIAVQGAPKVPETVNAGGNVNVGAAKNEGLNNSSFFVDSEPENFNSEVTDANNAG